MPTPFLASIRKSVKRIPQITQVYNRPLSAKTATTIYTQFTISSRDVIASRPVQDLRLAAEMWQSYIERCIVRSSKASQTADYRQKVAMHSAAICVLVLQLQCLENAFRASRGSHRKGKKMDEA